MALPFKTWRVLAVLREACGTTVTRTELIDRIWGGNHLVGEKGLTQAIWSIRHALGDNARAPRFLETIPRVGYRWLDAPSPHRPVRGWSFLSLSAMTVAAVALLVGAAVWLRPQPSAQDLLGARLTAGTDRLVVDMVQGCRRVFVAEPDMRFGVSQLSDDGQRILVEVIQASQCRMVEYDMLTNERRQFASCLSINPTINPI